MAAAGVVCLQEFAQYDDWRIAKNMEVVEEAVRDMVEAKRIQDRPPVSTPTRIYYVAQALYQVGGESVEAVLSAAARLPGLQPDARSRSPIATACGRPNGQRGGRARADV